MTQQQERLTEGAAAFDWLFGHALVEAGLAECTEPLPPPPEEG